MFRLLLLLTLATSTQADSLLPPNTTSKSYFTSSDGVLTLNMVYLDGIRYDRAKIQFNDDATWELLELDFNYSVSDVCQVDRKMIYEDVLVEAANRLYPDRGAAYVSSEENMRAFDDICSLPRNAYIMDALEDQVGILYPRFKVIKGVLNDYFGIFND